MTITRQIEFAQRFHALHVAGEPLVLYNVWDAGSARAVAQAGAAAIATGSWSVACAQGYEDGEKIPLPAVIANAQRICTSVDLPVSIDFEGGYAPTPAEVGANVAQVINTGTVGINFEDQIVGGQGLYDTADQAARIAAIRAAADKKNVPFFINARTDLFLQASPDQQHAPLLDAAIERAQAYAAAGASGFFVPGLTDGALIEKLCAACPLPVNVMMRDGIAQRDQLAGLGVARISHGPGPFVRSMEQLGSAAADSLR